MITIEEIRKKYPQYKDISDKELADKLHAKFYSDMPKEKFYEKISFSPKGEDIVEKENLKGTLFDLNANPFQDNPFLKGGRELLGGALETAAKPGQAIANLAARHIPGLTPIESTQVLSPEEEASGLAQVGKDIGSIAATGPYLMAGEAAIPAALIRGGLGRAMLGQGLGMASQSLLERPEQGLKGAAISGGLGAGFPVVGKLASAAMRPIQRYLATQALPHLLNKFESVIERLPEGSIQEALSNAYSKVKQKSLDWENKLIPLAQAADESESGKFDNNLFKKELSNLEEKYKPEMRRQKETYSPVLDAIKELKDDPLDSYQDAIKMNTYINNLPDTYEITNKPQQRILRRFGAELKDALMKQINENSKGSPLAKDFSELWKEQKQNYRNLKEFEKIPTKEGNLKYSKALAEKIGEEPNENIVKHFYPSNAEKEDLGMKHFSKLIGDEDKAKDLLKKEFVNRSMNQDILDDAKLLREYKKLSPKQREYMFGKEERDILNAAEKAKNLGKANKRKSSFDRLLNDYRTHFLLGGLGAMGGYHYGGPEGALLGLGLLGGSMAAKNKLGQFFSNPERLQALIKASQLPSVPLRGISYPLSGMTNALLRREQNGN